MGGRRKCICDLCLTLLSLPLTLVSLPPPRPTHQITENFAYLPFGGGRRKCIGDQFALFETLVALAMLTRRYDFSLAPDKPAVGMTTGKRGL